MSSRHVYKLPKHGPVPIEALELNETINMLTSCIEALWAINPRHINSDHKLGKVIMEDICSQLRVCRSYAQATMRHDYLDPRKKRIER